MLAAITTVGRDPRLGGVTRAAWSAADLELREWFAAEADRRGMDVAVDRAGNQWAWLGDPDRDGPGLVLGSHLDSVPGGGEFDGPLGVVSGFAVVDRLLAAGHPPERPVAVANFTDEEGARFGLACVGSRVLTGALDPAAALALRDASGDSLADVLTSAGRRPDELGPDPEALHRIGTFVELHIEQGRQLAAMPGGGVPVAVGASIWPHGRWRLDLRGRGDHAGTTLLADRDDPMLKLAAAITAARVAAANAGAVATIGKLDVRPGGVNAIPSAVTAWLDARSASTAAVRAVVADVGRAAEVEPTEESFTPATEFDLDVVVAMARALDGVPVLATGAGHDAGILSRAGIRAAMLFVRNPTGVSHSPEEWAEPADCAAGVDALHRVATTL